MIHEIHEISFRGHVARLATYFLDNSPEIDSGRIRPVVVVCPGGGYEMTSDREAEALSLIHIYQHVWLQRHGWIFRSG